MRSRRCRNISSLPKAWQKSRNDCNHVNANVHASVADQRSGAIFTPICTRDEFFFQNPDPQPIFLRACRTNIFFKYTVLCRLAQVWKKITMWNLCLYKKGKTTFFPPPLFWCWIQDVMEDMRVKESGINVPDPVHQCCGSMTLWCGSGSADPCLWLTDSDPRIWILLFSSLTFKMPTKTNLKKSFPAYYFLKVI